MPKYNIGESDETKLKMYLAKKHQLLDPATEKPCDIITKTSSKFKSDVVFKISGSNVIMRSSIKSFNGGNPTIINHTHAAAKCFKGGGYLNSEMPNITRVVERYISLREDGCPEDMSLKTIVGEAESNDIVSMLVYFTFLGTGKGPSLSPSNSIIYLKKNKTAIKFCPTDETKHSYVKSLLMDDKYIISLRTKGMPKTDNITDLHRKRMFGDRGGCIHIRIRTGNDGLAGMR